ncbi:MAG: NDP-sugar synthase [Thermoproteales archaeon]|nr:NDP-sugar synthase [Thermoproteales archaeon]
MLKTAVILAGGKGTRLRPLTYTIPKPLIPIGNIPIIEYILKVIEKTSSLEKVIIVVKYLGDKIRSYLNGIRDNFSFDILIPYVNSLDTADAVRKVSNFIDCDFFVLMGDILTNMNLNDFNIFHDAKGGMGTIALKEVENPLDFGVVLIDNESQIKLFLEKPRSIELYFMRMLHSKSKIKYYYENLVNTGFYAFKYKILDILDDNLELMDWGRHVFPFLVENGYKLFGWDIGEYYWADIGRPISYLNTTYEILDTPPPLLSPKGEQKDGIWLENTLDFVDDVVLIPPVVIGKNTFLGKNTVIGPYTVIGSNCKVMDNSKVSGSIILNNISIGRNTRVIRSIIGNNVVIRDEVVIEEYSVIGDDCIIEDKNIIRKNTLLKPYTVYKSPQFLGVKINE